MAEPFRPKRCDVFLVDCPARRVLTLLAEKWALLVIHALGEGTRRTGQLRRRVTRVSEKMLVQTLRRLEQNGLVRRTSYAEVPPRVDYEPTELGWSLSSVVSALDRWVEAHAEQMSA